MFADYFFLILSVAIIVGLGIHAYHNGVVSMLWGIIGAFTGIAGGVALYHFFLSGMDQSLGAKLALAFLGGVIIYFIGRAIAKSILLEMFEPEGIFHFLSEGIGGVVMSLVPSLLTIAVLAFGLRIGGTLTELRRYELLATPDRHFLVEGYPETPLATRWRNGMEDLPKISEGLDTIEPYGRLPERQLVGLLIVTKKSALRRHLEENPESKPIFESAALLTLMDNEEVQALNQGGNRIALLRHPDVRAAALEPGLRQQLETLELDRLVDGYLLSPEWQSIIKSYKREPGETDPPEKADPPAPENSPF